MVAATAVAFVAMASGQTDRRAPVYAVDPAWPKPLPNRWLVGAIAGITVDARDHVWVVHRPSTLQPNETRSIWRAAPPVLEFDQDGTLLSSWGGAGDGYEWPDLEHGIYVDHEDNVWLGGGGEKDAQVLKFTRTGRFLMQIGRKGKNTGSNDTQNLGGAANVTIDRAANELYVADGYVNHRVIVFDVTTGAYKRHWGAYGKRPDDGYFTRAGERLPSPFSGVVQHENRPSQYDPDGPPSPEFRIVHVVRIASDGLVYVCDHTNLRIQVFRRDGTNQQIWMLWRIRSRFSARGGRRGGGRGSSTARTTADSKGNLFITENVRRQACAEVHLQRAGSGHEAVDLGSREAPGCAPAS